MPMFGRKRAPELAASVSRSALDKLDRISPELRATMDEARRRGASDPLVQLRAGGRYVLLKLQAALRDDRGINVDLQFSILGALAGFACVSSVMRMLRDAGKAPTEAGLLTVETQDGQRYFFGDPINNLLLESRLSVAGIVIGTARALGAVEVPNLNDIISHVASSVGEPAFGLPRLPTAHMPGEPPINFVRGLWSNTRPLLEGFGNTPADWPAILAMAAGEAMTEAKSVVEPGFAALMILESAFPMAKIDPALIEKF